MLELKRLALGLVTCGVILGLSSGAHAQTEQPSSLVKVGQYTASTDFLNLSSYYQTTRRTKIKVAYTPTYHVGHLQKNWLTLPKHTIVPGDLTMQKKGTHLVPQLQLFPARLSYQLLAKSQPQGYSVDPSGDNTASTTVVKTTRALSAFKRINCPTYMLGYSHGDLYFGGAKSALSPQEPTATSIRITPDGYVEFRRYATNTVAGLGFYQRPQGAAQIVKTDFHDPIRTLSFNSPVRGLTNHRVQVNGRTRYQLTFKNLHRPQHITGNPLTGVAGTFDSLYLVNHEPYYTFIGFDGASN